MSEELDYDENVDVQSVVYVVCEELYVVYCGELVIFKVFDLINGGECQCDCGECDIEGGGFVIYLGLFEVIVEVLCEGGFVQMG